jgi:hypothetical protein
VLYPAKEISVLMLPKGSFLIRAIDKTGKMVGSYNEVVK